MPYNPKSPVLIVDDNFAIVRIVKALLNAQGIMDTDGAGSGPEAIRMLSKKDYGFVICDYFMMPMNGIDLKLVMDRRAEWSTIPFLLMTTREETFDMSKFERANLKNVLLKPFTADSLIGEMNKMADARSF